MPGIDRWPGTVPAGTVTSELGNTMDLITTCIRLAGGEPPSDRPIDGLSLLPVLRGSGALRAPGPLLLLPRQPPAGGACWRAGRARAKAGKREPSPRPVRPSSALSDPGSAVPERMCPGAWTRSQVAPNWRLGSTTGVKYAHDAVGAWDPREFRLLGRLTRAGRCSSPQTARWLERCAPRLTRRTESGTPAYRAWGRSRRSTPARGEEDPGGRGGSGGRAHRPCWPSHRRSHPRPSRWGG